MQTLKIKYKTSNEGCYLINDYRRQQSCVIRFAYNRAMESMDEKSITREIETMNNIELLDSFFIRSSVKFGVQLSKTQSNMIFGGKSNFVKRCKHKISKEEFKEKRLSPIYCIGEANQMPNRKFRICQDCNHITFQPNKRCHIDLEISGRYKNYKQILSKLYTLQQEKSIPITYELDSTFIYLSFDESKISDYKPESRIENRIFSIDLNPNYVGWSVVDWKSSSEFSVADSGTISIKKINDLYYSLRTKHSSSDSKERIYINNKREHEIYEISKFLVNKALHYKCEIFSMEELSMKSEDKYKGSGYNALVNNMWNKNKFIDNIKKRCNIFKIKLIEAKAAYSSFVGNFLFRDLNKPDMVLASIEIGRRAYEYNEQYIKKTKEIKKNIIRPNTTDFYDRYATSLEEFDIDGDFRDLVELYYFFKNPERRYRVSLDDLKDLKFCRCFSSKSLIMQIF